MKSEPDLEENEENVAKKKTFCSKCLPKEIKLSSFLGSNPNNFSFSRLTCFG